MSKSPAVVPVAVPTPIRVALRALTSFLAWQSLPLVLWLARREAAISVLPQAVGIMALIGGLTAGLELRVLFRVHRWRRRLDALAPLVMAKMGWADFEQIVVSFAPGALRFVASTALGIVELVCSLENEIVICVVKPPEGFRLDEGTWKQWDSFEREYLLERVEQDGSSPLRWRHGDLRSRGVPLSIRAPSIEEGLDYVASLVHERYPAASEPQAPAHPGTAS